MYSTWRNENFSEMDTPNVNKFLEEVKYFSTGILSDTVKHFNDNGPTIWTCSV